MIEKIFHYSQKVKNMKIEFEKILDIAPSGVPRPTF